MPTCGQCDGEGRVTYEEDGRQVTDACYHCGTTGQIDEDCLWHDHLMECACVLGHAEENEYRTWRDSDHEGEGYDFCAAEHGLRGHEYFSIRCDDRMYEWAPKLADLSLDAQVFLVSWCEDVSPAPWAGASRKDTSILPPPLREPVSVCGTGADDIPF